MSEAPTHAGQRGRAWGHDLKATEGRFDGLVWQCQSCAAVRTKKQFFRNVDCNPADTADAEQPAR